MSQPMLFVYEVTFPIAGMPCRLLVNACSEARALAVVAKQFDKVAAENTAIALDCAIVQPVNVMQDIEAIIAEENRVAASANITTVDYCEKDRCFVVKCNGEIMEWFSTMQQAQDFANEHDHLTHGREAARA